MTKQDCLLYLAMLNALMQKIVSFDDCLKEIKINHLRNNQLKIYYLL